MAQGEVPVRGDSGFVRENFIRWRENNRVDYVFGLARNDYLLKKNRKVRGKAGMAMIKSTDPVRAYGDFQHMTKTKSWT